MQRWRVGESVHFARRAGGCGASRLGAGCRTQNRRGASRHQTGKHHDQTGRLREGPRFGLAKLTEQELASDNQISQ